MSGHGSEQSFGARNSQPPPFGRQSSAPVFSQSSDAVSSSSPYEVSPITPFSPAAPVSSSTYSPSHRSGLDWQTREATANHLLSSGQALPEERTGHHSPDPDDFYRQRDELTTDSPHVTGNLGNASTGVSDGMAPAYGDLNDRVSPLPANALESSRQRPARPEYRSVSDSPTVGISLLGSKGASAAAPSFKTRQTRQSSFKDLVNKFNNTSDQVLPFPSVSRTTSRTASPSGSADGSERSRSRAFSRRLDPIESPPHTPPRISTTSNPRQQVDSTPASPEAVTFASASQNATDTTDAVPPPLFQRIPRLHPRRPLFGELLSVDTQLNNLGFSLPAHLKRRGSDGSLPSPNPAFVDQSNPPSARSPLTPTAWYLGQAPSLEAVQPKTSKTSSHRRVRSDLEKGAPREPLADPWEPEMAVRAPLQRAKDGSASPGSPHSPSRIPVSSLRLSTGSGPSSPTSNPTFSCRSTGIPLAPKGTSRLPKPSSKDSPPRTTADGPASFAMTARGRRDLTIARTRNQAQVPGRNQRLQAYIAAPPPKKSPPLRSSRPRQPVSHGAPPSPSSKVGDRVSSFQRASERDTEARNPSNRPPRRLPELGNVDFATRRQQIQQAINRTVQENERREQAATELRHRSRKPEELRGEVQSPPDDEATTPSTAITSTSVPSKMAAAVTEANASPQVSDKELHTVPQLHLNTAISIPEQHEPHTAMDSPTLGVPDNLVRATPATGSQPHDNDTPNSAATSDSTGTHVTTFDPEPQSGLLERKPSLSHQTLLNQIMQIREASSGSDTCDEPDCSMSEAEADDKESIQIMLGNTHAEDAALTLRQAAQVPKHPEARWSMSSWSSSLRNQPSTCGESGEDSVLQSAILDHEPESATQSCSAMSSPASDIAGDYPVQDIGVTGPETLEASQNQPSHAFSTPPSLARLGRWDSRRATQLYLQGLTMSRNNTVQLPVQRTLEAHRPYRPELRADGRVNSLTEDPVVIPGYQEVPITEQASHAASLRGPEDWEHASPSILDWMHIAAEHEAVTPATEDLGFSPGSMPTPRMGHTSQITETGDAKSGLDLSLHTHPEESSGPAELSAEPAKTLHSSQGNQIHHYHAPNVPALQTTESTGSSEGSSLRRLESTQSPHAAASSVTSLAPSDHRTRLEPRKSPSPEQKRLKKRRHIIKELVDTEYTFGRDMKVVDDIYKGTAESCSDLTKDDIKILFGNSDQVVHFSFAFQDTLKKATRSIYVMPKSQRWSSKRSAQDSRPSSSGGDELAAADVSKSDLENDRSTCVGDAFIKHIAHMEKVHATNLKTRDAANKKLETLQQRQNVNIWLTECRSWAEDLTEAWDLGSLLVKPFQRVLKYPLLLTALLEATPTDHPDHANLSIALQKTNEMTERLNKLKGRVETFDQSLGRGRKESDVRANLSKAFGRRTEKLRQQVGLSEMVEDKAYDEVSNLFGENYMQLQVIVRDFTEYTTRTEAFAEQLLEFVLAFDGMLDVSTSSYPEQESKWHQFKTTVVEIRQVALPEHVREPRYLPDFLFKIKTKLETVQTAAVEPINQLLQLHVKPARAMKRREKRLLDHARYQVAMERGDTPDKKLKEQEAHFEALDQTLKEELPQLYELSRKLAQACLRNFIEAKTDWLSALQKKIEPHVQGFPPDFQKILGDFGGEHSLAESQILSLGMCNGSLLAETVNLVNFNTPSTNVHSSRRPSTVSSRSNPRPGSMAEDSPKVSHDYGVGQLFQSPHVDSQSTFSRTRANSSFSGRVPAPETPDTSRSQILQQVTHGSAPNTQANKRTDTEPFPSLPRLSLDTPFLSEVINASSSTENSLPTSPGGRYSGFFSSAMPMSDTPNEDSRASGDHPVEPRVLFLAASVEQFTFEGARGEAGYPYLTYESGDVFDVIGEKGELWLARNQDDPTHQIGWIWNKHFSKVGA
ncbi:hypothetical protein N7532_011235 [Penicillium argentinense]|uniref:DH domain-containing protein n=1 Tax=Penicillium argentinense TaxID=1131581 RepID=A0A9W9EI60_9EURO|nr:uncharacterized protein N7532_011235 [Penicillium argentinense]KAJ5082192.1 hypothetical protein N7532_011235 [Penicillium argentinense]